MFARLASHLVVAVALLAPAVALAGSKTVSASESGPVNAIPEPTALVAFAVGAAIVGGVVRRSRRQR